MEWDLEYWYRFKVITIGNLNVGKTSLLERYCFGEFSDYRPVVGRDFPKKTVDVFGTKVRLMLWEPDGQERYRCLTSSFYRGTDCIVLTFDLTNMTSFRDIEYWLKNARDHTTDECLFLLVGNKADKVDERVVPRDMARSFAESIGVQYIETSAKTSANVEATFQSIAETLVRQQSERFAAESVNIVEEKHDKDRCFGGVTP